MTPEHSTHRAAVPPEKIVELAIESITALQDVYLEETEALDRANTKAFLALQDRKLRAAQRYQASVEELIRRKEDVKALGPDIKTRFQTMQSDFSALATRNKLALERMQRCMVRLGETVREAAKEAAAKGRTYSYTPNGQLRDDERRAISMGLSETA